MIQTTQSFEVRGPERQVDVVLKDTLQKILAAAPRRLKELRDECEAELKRLDSLPATGAGVTADEFFASLKLACEASGLPKVVSIALEGIQKLISYGFLTGRGRDPFKAAEPGQPPRQLIDTVIESVSTCAESADDTVQLHMINALCAAVISQTCEVHGKTLIQTVSTCVTLHRDSKSATNQRMAQTALTQMLSVISQRLELSSADAASKRSADDMQRPPPKTAASPKQLLAAAAAHASSSSAGANGDLALLPKGELLNDWMGSYLNRLVDEVVLKQPDGQNGGAEKVLPGKFGWCVVCRGTALHYCVDTRDPVCGHKCKYRNLERLALVETHYGGNLDANGSDATTVTAVPSRQISTVSTALDEVSVPPTSVHGDTKLLSPCHEDAILVFSYLCRLSIQELPTNQADTRIVRSKRIALELILGMLQNCGPVFRSSEHFINLLKQQLCVSLIKNSVSPVPKIFGLSLQIFVALISHYKEHLRTEIGVFIEQIFLRILESGNSTFQHKSRVLNVFYKLCTDATTALELFLNFDCDVDEKNIFERTVDCLSKIAQGKYTAAEHANVIQPHQEQELKLLALQALVTLMGSIVDWARRMTEDQKPTLGILGSAGQAEDGNSSTRNGVDSDDDARSEAAASLASGAASALPSAVSSLVESKQRKLELQIGVNKFNMKAKRGIEYLKLNGFLSDEPEALAALFKNKDLGLDKTVIGDFMGEDKPFNKQTLYALVDGLDFKGQDLDSCLRNFLSFFRLPGEAQKIDRMMEKFADKFCLDNPGRFANADCAFVLSFSLIMLQTDLHNPGIKNKMTKDEFVRNNRGINDGQDIPRDYLESLYDGVATNRMSLKEDEEARRRNESTQAQGVAQKLELFVKETENIVKNSEEMMKKVSRRGSVSYVTADSADHVKPLFEVACWPYLATLAVLLEMQDAEVSVGLCIEGFKHCIRIAARFDMDTERDAFVSSLAKFTYLTTIKEMKPKNIECIKALLAIGISEGNNLGPSWQYVLICISQLERLQLIGSKSKADFQFFQEDEAGQSPSSMASKPHASTAGTQVIKRRAHGLGVSALVALGVDDRQTELVNSEVVAALIDSTQIDMLFNKSKDLNSNAIVHFVNQLCKVSKDELALVDQPRIFSLQKLVEVADCNMSRMRVVWARVWRSLSTHFAEVASHQNLRVAIFAIDSLRQLSIKFLEKDELSNYNFQADFLKPFELVMVSTPGAGKEVKGFIVESISFITNKRGQNIKSGWKTVFHICYAAAQESGTGNEATLDVAFSILAKVTEHNYSLFVENFTDGVRALLAFGQCKAKLQLSLDAISYLLKAADYLADPTSPDPPPPPSSSLSGVAAPASTSGEGNSHPAAHWFPILRGLSMLVSDPRREVRQAALNGVFDVLKDRGSQVFDEDTWRMVFNGVIKPLFDDIHHQLLPSDKQDSDAANSRSDSWAGASQSMGPATCLEALTQLNRLFEAHLDSLAFLLEDVLRLIQNCIQHEYEALARIGVEGLKQLLNGTGKKLKPESWQKVTKSILLLFRDSMPTKLMHVDIKGAPSTLPFSKDDVVTQCVVQLLLIDMLQDAVANHYEHIPPQGIMTLLDALQQSFEFAQEFNRQIDLRQALKRLGFMKEMKQLPGLLKQERESLSCSLKLLFQVQADPRTQGTELSSQAVERLLRLCKSVLLNYVGKERLLNERAESPPPADLQSDGLRDREAATLEIEREVQGLVPIISEVVLKGLRDLPPQQFDQHISELFPLFCELTIVSSREVRMVIREVLLEKVTPLLAASATAALGSALSDTEASPGGGS